MSNLYALEKELKKLEDRYQEAIKKLSSRPSNLSFVAQEAQNLWAELKKVEAEYNNASVMKEMAELYGV